MRLFSNSAIASANNVSGTDRVAKLTQREKFFCGSFHAMSSPCEVLIETNDEMLAKSLLDAVATEAWRIEDKFSRYIRGNIIDRINGADSHTVEVDLETANLIDFSVALHEMSAGAFDITSGVLREVWSFDGSDNVPTDRSVAGVLARVGWKKVVWQSPCIQLRRGMQIDLGGIGKEYAVDRAAAIVMELADQPCLINFGGDIRAIQSPSESQGWQVGIEALENNRIARQMIRLKQGGLATSGDAHRFLLKNGIRYSHVLNPRTGWPVPDAPRSVTVAADTCTQAGMLATLAMLQGAGAEAFLERESVQYWCYR